jgi:predicted phosphodiesterase
MPEPRRVLVVGDLHGNTIQAEQCCDYAQRKGCDAVLQVGDFGFWTPGVDNLKYLKRVEKAAEKFDLIFYWLDGNHEDHSRRHEFDSELRPRTRYLPRGHRWTWWGKRFMAVGGAVSVDKHERVENRSWWRKEILTDEEIDYAIRDDGIPVDVVFSHDCPSGVNIPGIGPDSKGTDAGWPADVIYEASIHRNKMRTVFRSVHPKLWIHGHYHIPYHDMFEATLFYGLGRDGTKMLDVTKVLDPENLLW